jgi:diguanylate cyclase (GGDEF)-like protein/PAS domain S-box-containing protein
MTSSTPPPAVHRPAAGPLDDEPLDPATLAGALHDLLDENPSALTFALDATASRVPLPDHERFAGSTTLPGEQPTAIDFVVGPDRLAVIRCWERARTVGLGRARVRLAHRPDRTVTLTLVDCRHEYGVWIGVLVPEGGWGPAPGELDPALLVPNRPRTAVLRKDLYGVVLGADEHSTRMLGWPAEELVGIRSLDLIHPDDQERAVGQWLEMRATRQTQRVRLRHRHRDGHWIWVEVENTYVGPTDGERDDPEGVVAVAHMTDISDEMAAVEALRRQERLFRRLIDSLPVGVFQLRPGRGTELRIGYSNARLGGMLGVRGARTLAEQIARVDPADRARLTDAVVQALATGADRQVEVDAGWRRYLVTVAVLVDPGGPADTAVAGTADGGAAPGAIVSVTDVTESARLHEELRIRATHDALTGLLNRAAVLEELGRAVAAPGVERLALVFVDLDRFKAVNDTHGHAVGDELLAIVARRLTAQARRGDLVGRIGGDEFLLVCPGVPGRAAALALGRRVHDRLRGTFQVAGLALRTAASVGVAMGSAGSSADDLVARSDDAMYRAKRSGSGPVLHAGM